jgi:hypothetical protein
MLDPRVYEEAYGLRYLPFRGTEDGLYLLHSLSGRPLLSTSPYLTDTPDLPVNDDGQRAYREFVFAQHERFKPAFTLVKTRDFNFANILAEGCTIETTAVSTILNLEAGEKALWDRMDRKRRKQIERGRELKPEFRVGRPDGRNDLLRDFYSVFVETQTRLGTPVHSQKFFDRILTYHPSAHVMVGYVEGLPATGALLISRKSALYHPYTGTLAKYFSTYLNCALYWEMILWGIQQSAKEFDLGRSFLGSGVHAFKKYWGGTDVPLYYCYRTDGRIPDFSAWHLKAATRAWRWLPRSVARTLGPYLIRSVP